MAAPGAEDPGDDDHEHLVDLYCDVIGKEPGRGTPPAELVAARLGLTRHETDTALVQALTPLWRSLSPSS